MDRYINAPLTDEDAQSLRAGDYVYITGTIYTARDAAHLRMYEALEHGEPLPVEMAHNIIYPDPSLRRKSLPTTIWAQKPSADCRWRTSPSSSS